MFREEAKQKYLIQSKFDEAEAQMRKAHRDDAELRRKVASLTDDLARKERLALLAMAARGQFKQTLNDYQ